MFILHGGQVTGPFDPNDVAAKATSRSLPADAMMGPSAQGPWMPVYAVATPTSAHVGTAQGLVIIAVGSVVVTALLVWLSGVSRKPIVEGAPPTSTAPEAATAVAAPPSDGRGGFRKMMCPLKAFQCTVGGPDWTVMTIENGVGCPITAAAFVKDPKPLNDVGFLVVRCPTGQEWHAPSFARAK